MRCTPAVLNLHAGEVRAQVGKGGEGEAGGTRVGSSSNSSLCSSSLCSSNLCSSNSSNSSSLSTVAARVEVTDPPNSLGKTAGRYIWDDSGPVPFGTGGKVLSMDWAPTEPQPESWPPTPPRPTGCVPLSGGAHRGRGRRFRCKQVGHSVHSARCPPRI